MRKVYFVGGLKLDQSEEFSRFPGLAGRKLAAWCIYPLSPNDGKNANVAEFEPQGVMWNRLLHADVASQWSQLVVITDRVQ